MLVDNVPKRTLPMTPSTSCPKGLNPRKIPQPLFRRLAVHETQIALSCSRKHAKVCIPGPLDMEQKPLRLASTLPHQELCQLPRKATFSLGIGRQAGAQASGQAT